MDRVLRVVSAEEHAKGKADLEYWLVIGAYAMAPHGVPRYTGDFDVFIRPTPLNGERLLSAIRDFGFPTQELTTAQVIDPRRVIQMGLPPRQRDTDQSVRLASSRMRICPPASSAGCDQVEASATS